jgi:hypothetical protein
LRQRLTATLAVMWESSDAYSVLLLAEYKRSIFAIGDRHT